MNRIKGAQQVDVSLIAMKIGDDRDHDRGFGKPKRLARAAALSEAIDAGRWMHTGDLAVMDEAGYLNIVGRIKDLVIRGGENIYPREVEEFLFTHPKVQGVSCFGVPDARYGEALCAWIVLRPGTSATPAELRQHCEGEIAHYKIPRYFEFVDEFPMTVTGKIQKFIMRDVMIERLGLTIEKTA